MLKSFKTRLLAGVTFFVGGEPVRDLVRTFTRAVFRLVKPLSLSAARLGCACHGPRHLLDNCPYHGVEARRLIRG